MTTCDRCHASDRIHDQRMTYHTEQLNIAGTVAIGKRLRQINATFLRQVGDQFSFAAAIGKGRADLAGKSLLLLLKFSRQ